MVSSTILKFCAGHAFGDHLLHGALAASRDQLIDGAELALDGGADAAGIARGPNRPGRAEITVAASVVIPSGTWLCGTYMTPTSPRSSPASRTLPTMPTIWRGGSSNSGPRPLPMTMTWPMGSSFGQYFFAMFSLMTTTRAEFAISVLAEDTAAQERDLEHLEVVRRNRAPLLVAVVLALRGRLADDVERQIDAALHRQHERGCGGLHAGQAFERRTACVTKASTLAVVA